MVNNEEHEDWTVLETIPRPFYAMPEKELIFKEFETKLQKRRDWKESGHKPKDNLLQHVLVKFGDPIPHEVAMEHANAWTAVMRPDTKKRFQALKITLTQLFDRRPLWQRRSLDRLEELQSTSANLLSNTLTLFAYHYVTGPFKGLLVRLGYDPSHYAESRFFQVGVYVGVD